MRISPETRLIIHQEFLRAILLGFLMLVLWVVLVLREVIPASGWSFLALVPGLTAAIFLLVVLVRSRTGWRLGAPGPAAMRRWERNLNVFLLWVLFSLLAIAYIGERPYLGLAIAVVGGIIMGVVAFRNFEATMREERKTQGAVDTYTQEKEQTEESLQGDDET